MCRIWFWTAAAWHWAASGSDLLSLCEKTTHEPPYCKQCACVCLGGCVCSLVCLSACLTIPPFTPPSFSPSLLSEVSSSSVMPLDNNAWKEGGLWRQLNKTVEVLSEILVLILLWKSVKGEWVSRGQQGEQSKYVHSHLWATNCWNKFTVLFLTSLMKGMYSLSFA